MAQDAIALPSLAVMMTDAIYDGMFGGEAKGGRHPATFSGYRLAAACSLGFFEILEEEKLLENLIKMSGYFNFQLRILQTTGYPLKNIVVKGLCIAFEIVPKADEYNAQTICLILIENGILTTIAPHNQDSIRLIPAFNISTKEIDKFIDGLRNSFDNS